MNLLRNQTVLVTRPGATSVSSSPDALIQLLTQMGANVISHPVVEILPPMDWDEVDLMIADWHQFEWLVFTSSHGVRYFLSHCQQQGVRTNDWQQKKIAVVGDHTGAALAEFSLEPQLIPEDFESESLANELVNRIRSEPGPVLLVRGSRGSRVLPDTLRFEAIPFREIVVYRSVDVEQADGPTKEMMEAGKIDWTTITSSAIARSTISLFGDRLRKTKLASISPQTSRVLREYGFQPAVEAEIYSMEGLRKAMIDQR